MAAIEGVFASPHGGQQLGSQTMAHASSWHLPHLTFTHGFLVGQFTILVAVVALIRYFLLEDAAKDSSLTTGNEVSMTDQSATKRKHFPVTASLSKRSASSLLSFSFSSLPNRTKSPPPVDALTSANQSYGSGPSMTALLRIPEAVGHDMETVTDSDVGWLNVLIAHAWEGYRDDWLAGGSRHIMRDPYDPASEWSDEEGDLDDEGDIPTKDAPPDIQRTARDLMHEIINRPKVEEGKLDFLDELQVTECLVGNSYPILSNARVRPRDDQGRLRIEIDVDYNDLLSLSLQSAILINYPRPRFAVLPISLGLRLTRFSGTLSISLTSHPPAETARSVRSRHSLELSLHPDFLLSATCSSLVGSRAKLQDIPKIQQLILQRLRQAISDKIVWPQTFTVELPDLVKRKKHSQYRMRKGRRRRSQAGADSPNVKDRDDADPRRMRPARMDRESPRSSRPRAPAQDQSKFDRTPRAQRTSRVPQRRHLEGDPNDDRFFADSKYAYASALRGQDPQIPTRRRDYGYVNGAKGIDIPKRPSEGSINTSVSRRPPNVRYGSTPAYRDYFGAHREPENGAVMEEDEAFGPELNADMSPPGSMPTVEAWRKDMETRTAPQKR